MENHNFNSLFADLDPIYKNHCKECGKLELDHYWKCEKCGMVGNGENFHTCIPSKIYTQN